MSCTVFTGQNCANCSRRHKKRDTYRLFAQILLNMHQITAIELRVRVIRSVLCLATKTGLPVHSTRKTTHPPVQAEVWPLSDSIKLKLCVKKLWNHGTVFVWLLYQQNSVEWKKETFPRDCATLDFVWPEIVSVANGKGHEKKSCVELIFLKSFCRRCATNAGKFVVVWWVWYSRTSPR